MAEFPNAQEVWLEKIKKITPKFHQHIAASKMKKEPHRAGDEVVGYRVVRTVPDGPVIATDETSFHYE